MVVTHSLGQSKKDVGTVFFDFLTTPFPILGIFYLLDTSPLQIADVFYGWPLKIKIN